jgi:parallel beta-helix repeat protein
MAGIQPKINLFKMKKPSVIIICFILFATALSFNLASVSGEQAFAGPTYVGGTITTSQTWTLANSPYIINNNLTVGTGGTLFIQPGVTVKLDLDNYLTVRGNLYANGTVNQPIQFESNDTQNFTKFIGIKINSDGNSVMHTNFSDCYNPINITGTQSVPIKNNLIDHIFSDYAWDEGILLKYADNNIISNNTLNYDAGLQLFDSNSNVIRDNAITGAYDAMLRLKNSDQNKFYNNIYNENDGGSNVDIHGSSNNEFHNDFLNFSGGGDFNHPYALFVSNNSRFNTFYDFEYYNKWGWDSFFAFEGSNDITFINMSFNSTAQPGLYLKQAKDIDIIESYIYANDASDFSSIDIDDWSSIYLIDTTLLMGYDDITYFDKNSTYNIQTQLTVEVKDKVSGNPISGASVLVKERFGISEGTFTTQSNGKTAPMPTTVWKRQDKDGSGWDNGVDERRYLTPHNITVSKATYYDNYAIPQPNMSVSKSIIVQIGEIPIDFIKIQDAPGSGGLDVNGRTYKAGTTHTFYASGYNSGAGYVKEVPAVWTSNDTSVATVTTPGITTTFSSPGQSKGAVKVTATDGPASGTADLTIEEADIDYILIQDTDNANGNWIGNRQYQINDVDTYYAGGYNTTHGFLKTVSAIWTSENTNIVTVGPPGTSTTVTFSSSNFGSTGINADFGALGNKTGKLTIPTHGIDSIIIRTQPDGNGTYVGSQSYMRTDTDIFFCAGYNATFGYVMDVFANWDSEDVMVGSIVGKGVNTIFTTLEKGTTRVIAYYEGLTNYTGVLTVNPLPGDEVVELGITLQTVPPSPLLGGTQIEITATITNTGTDPVNNVVVHFMVMFPGSTSYSLESNNTIATLNSDSSTNLVYPISSLDPGTHLLKAIVDPIKSIKETDESNNEVEMTVEVNTLEEWVETIIVEPDVSQITADDTQRFTAFGIGKDKEEINIDVTWSTSGGGLISSEGVYDAEKVGVWEVYASFGEIKGTAIITVTAGELRGIEITNNKRVHEVGDSFQFEVAGYDTDGNRIEVPTEGLEWYVNGTIGEIDPSGMFNATEPGIGFVGAVLDIGGIIYTAEVEVPVVMVIIIEKEFNLATEKADFNIKIGFIDDGNASMDFIPEENITKELPGGDETFGDDFEHIGVFVKIEIPEEIDWDWIYIECEYDPALLPPGFNPADLELFYFDDSTGTWIKCENTGVDTERHVVFANVTHLTIFAPMADTSSAEESPDGGGDEGDGGGVGLSLITILGLVAVVFVVAIAAGVIIIRKRKVPMADRAEKDDLTEEELVEQEERESKDVDLSDLEVISTKCPKCKAGVDIEPAFDDKVQLECPDCGTKGKMPNPYLKEIERLKEARRQSALREKRGKKEDKVDLIDIPCRNCKEPVEIPFSDSDEKVSVKCGECGAKGKIKNPYLDKLKKEEEESLPREPKKPPKRRKPEEIKKGKKDRVDEETVEFEDSEDEFEISESDLDDESDDDEDLDFDLS